MLKLNSCSGVWIRKVLNSLLNQKNKLCTCCNSHVIPNVYFWANAAGTYLLRVRMGMLVLLLL